VILLKIATYNERALQVITAGLHFSLFSGDLCVALIYSDIIINMTNNPDYNKPEYEYANNDGCAKNSGHAVDSLPL
jgi:hypothetical protein